MIKRFLNPKGHQNSFSGSKIMPILLKGLIWPIGGVTSGRVCACSLQSRLVFEDTTFFVSQNNHCYNRLHSTK